MRIFFAYAINPDSPKFSPLPSAATILHPSFCSLLPANQFERGKGEIERWLSKISAQQTPVPIQNTASQSNMFGRLAAEQRQTTLNSVQSHTKYVKHFCKYVLISLFCSIVTLRLLLQLKLMIRTHFGQQTKIGFKILQQLHSKFFLLL